jgi:selenocysteine-specific elongation factor
VRDLMREHAHARGRGAALAAQALQNGRDQPAGAGLFYHPARWPNWRNIVATLPEVQASSFRDATGLGRKRSIQILEFFNRVGYTRRVGNIHLIRPNAVWSYSGGDAQ